MNYLERVRTIKDSVYQRTIKLTAEEMAIIDHPLFQRLRFIHQLGLVSLVWPDATHKRFMHSIGALAMAQELLDALYHRSRAARSKLTSPGEATPGMAVQFHGFGFEVLRMVQRVTRLSAMDHDLGHGPLSHAFDTFAPKVADVAQFLDDERLAALRPFREQLLAGKGGLLRHEAVSCILFAVIWHDLGNTDPWMPTAVASVLLPAEAPIGTVPDQLLPFLPLITDIVASAPIDADRMDYILRDSKALGLTSGQYELDRILGSVLCIAGEPRPQGMPTFRLGWRLSGLGAIEQFVTARFFLFRDIYAHKTYRAFELMLARIAAVARDRGLVFVNAVTLDEFVDQYCQFSDDVFLRTLAGQLHTATPLPQEIRELAKRILWRKPWKRVYEFKRSMYGHEAELSARMKAAHPKVEFILDERKIHAMKDLSRGAKLYAPDEHGRYRLEANPDHPGEQSWLDESAMLKGLHADECHRSRLYVKRSMMTPADAELIDQLRADALRFAAELRHERKGHARKSA